MVSPPKKAPFGTARVDAQLPFASATTMKADDTDDRAANSQEIIDASFELGSSSLELGSYYQNAKQGGCRSFHWFG